MTKSTKLPKSSGKLKRPKPLLRRVVGDSMRPAFRPGQLVVVAPGRQLHVGDVVMIRHEGLEKIKRIARLQEARVYVLGDNPAASTDSRNFGWVGLESVVGKVVWPKPKQLT